MNMEVTNDELKKIKEIIVECIENWHAVKNKNPFSWVDDRLWMMIAKQMPEKLSDCDFAYNIHIAWVRAWNYIDRKTPMDAFLEGWATDENIKKAIDEA